MYAALGKFIYRYRWFVLIAGIAFMVAAGVFGTSLFGMLKGGGYDNPASESFKAVGTIHDQLGQEDASLVVLFTSKDNTTVVDSPAFAQGVSEVLSKLDGKPYVGKITNYYNSGATQLVSNNKLSTYAIITLAGDTEEQQKHAKELLPLLTSATLKVQVGGQAMVYEQISEQVSKDLETAEMATFPILAILLVLIFGSLIAAALPLAIGGIAILGAFLLLRVAVNFTDVSIFAINIITMLGLGLAIDYSLFVVSRFRDELKRYNGDTRAALVKTMQTAGRTVTFSGLTVAISLLSLQVFPQMFLQSMGLGGAAAVLVAVIASITILPAMLALLSHRVNALSIWSIIHIRRNSEKKLENRGFWYNLSTFVMRRPVVVLLFTVLPLMWVGLPFLRVNLATPDARSLPATAESRIVSEYLSNEFPRNETVPIQLVLKSNSPMLNAANITTLYDYTRKIEAVPGVRRVDSLVTLDSSLDKNAYVGFYSDAGLAQNPQAQIAATHYAKGNYALVSVLYDSDQHSGQAQELVKTIRGLGAPAGMTLEVGGETAYLVDFLASLEESVPFAVAFIVATIFILLFLMLGSVVIPLKAVILNTLSLSVSFGALVWVFQDGNLANVLGFTPLGSIDGTQPILIFAIAFGLSMDYEVFLLSRVKEHYDRFGDTTAAVAHGIQKTGGIITSAAILLVVVIGGFAAGEVVFIKQVGVGLALAILVDATIVRALLVPAAMRLMGKYNWWAPAPLAALYRRAGLSEVEHEDESTPPTSVQPSLFGSRS
ncbi:MAG: MMPL family transporter [Chloroflexi bacterium]|uniref:MMPL family transporter n=1 Tax=Candidatus Chlorohelix allophototropha TaxID=3003348 RepID=A0A8T7M0R3_9CHLR|nr:MMPL family transporter [Chloroflexota bacterium]WJW65753.1 MMPL family transporter [Chloroflexota bacterium L227-S17]